MHPLINDLSAFKDNELESKIAELAKKYFMTQNLGIKAQIAAVLDSYRDELTTRRQAEWNKMMETRNKDLYKLINID